MTLIQLYRLYRLGMIFAALLLFSSATSAYAAAEQKEQVIEEGKQVSIEYTLELDDGTVVDSNVGKDPLTYKQGSGQILPALEDALAGMHVGETTEVSLKPTEGYGEINPDAYQEVPAEKIPEDGRKKGTVLMARDAEGQPHMVRVHEVRDDTVVLNLNHPLAGEQLNFAVRILDIE